MAYDRYVIRDLGSLNGVRVNGVVIDEARLNLGDEIAIGPFIYRLESLTPPSKPGPAKPVASRSGNSKPDSVIELDDDLIPLD